MWISKTLVLVLVLVATVLGEEDLEEVINEAKRRDVELLREQTELLYQWKVEHILYKEKRLSYNNFEYTYELLLNGTREEVQQLQLERDQELKEVNERLHRIGQELKVTCQYLVIK